MTLALYFIRRLWVLDRLGASWPMKLRLGRWIVRFSFREFAFQWAVVAAVLIALLAGLGATGGIVGTALVAILGALLLVDLWFAWRSWRSAAAVTRELADLPPEPDALRFPRTHLAFPLLMLFSRRVSVERGGRLPPRGAPCACGSTSTGRAGPGRARRRVPPSSRSTAAAGFSDRGSSRGSRCSTHLAANGWVGFNADYRLSPDVAMPEHVIDVKRAIAWVREHGAEHGADPERIVITGGSAGGHLAALAALTANDPALQPGFEDVDTSVVAAIPFYGVYDLTDGDRVYWHDFTYWLLEKIVVKEQLAEAREVFAKNSPTHLVHAGAPPFLIFHGDSDTIIPVEDARSFVAELEAESEATVRYVELPGADHAFDVFPSLRSAVVIEGIERFLRGIDSETRGAARRDRLVSSA